MTYGNRSASIMKNAANIARVQANADRRTFVTSPSKLALRSRITFDVPSYSSYVSTRAARYRLRSLGFMVLRSARWCAPSAVNATHGSGISSGVLGGNPTRTGTPTSSPNATLGGQGRMTRGNGKAVESVIHPVGDNPSCVVNPTLRHDAEKAGSTGPSFCCSLPEADRQSAELSRGYVGLSHSLALKPHRSGLILNARHLRPVAKLNEDNGSHRSLLPVAALVERHPVQQQ